MRDESGSNHGARGWWIAAVCALCGLAACEAGSGGAVELSWKLRPNSSSINDKFVDCEPGGDDPDRGTVTWIQLNWSVPGASAEADAGAVHSRAFHCDDNHGVTQFEIPVGTASLWVVPTCGKDPYTDEAAADTFIAPAPVIRDVKAGQTISLNAVELVISVFPCGDGAQCICK
jgi:hypothetical protein